MGDSYFVCSSHCFYGYFLVSDLLKLISVSYVDLNFRAINYFVEIYVNGHKEVFPKWMFRRHCVDISDMLNPDSVVLVYPPDHLGTIPPQKWMPTVYLLFNFFDFLVEGNYDG